MTNPYQPPSAIDPSPQPGDPFETVLRLATLHRHLHIAVAANIGIASLLGEFRGGISFLLCAIFAIATAIFWIITSIRIANILYGKNWAIMCGVLMFVPFINLFTLLVLIVAGRRRLVKEGIKVGYLGPNLADVRARIKAAQSECVHCAMESRDEKRATLCKICKRRVHKNCRKLHLVHAHAQSSEGP